MKILMLNSEGGGVGYYRMWQPGAALKAAGHDVTYFPDTDAALTHITHSTNGGVEQWLMRQMEEVDVVHMGYTSSMAVIQTMVCAREYAASLGRNVPLIIDIDDDPVNVPPYNGAFGQFHMAAPERKMVRMLLGLADGVTVSTAPLAKIVEPLAKRVYQLPNCYQPADQATLPPADKDRHLDKSVRLMFAGGRGRIGDIEVLKGPLEVLMERYNGDGSPLLRLIWVGGMPAWADQWMTSPSDPTANRSFLVQMSIRQTYWSAIKHIAPDIFVNPLNANKFNESKSFIKAYDAVLGGAAYVGTDWATHDPIPPYVMYKCTSPTQWIETLSYLIEDAGARRAAAERLRIWVLENCHIDRYIDTWVRAYEECASAPVIRTEADLKGG